MSSSGVSSAQASRIDVAFPAEPRATYPDARVDAVRGTFAVEQGPLVLALESPDLSAGMERQRDHGRPGKHRHSQGGATLDVYRRTPATEAWPYYQERHENEGERVRARLIPYHQWANRGPATMRVWLPLAGADDRNQETRGGDEREAKARTR